MNFRSQQKGQVMLLTTLVMSGLILASTTVAGLLMLYQIRQSGNAEQSAKSIYAADAGIEYQLYQLFTKDCAYAQPTPTNLSSIDSQIDLEGSSDPSSTKDVVISSSGRAGRTYRSFVVDLGAYTDTLPCAASSPTP